MKRMIVSLGMSAMILLSAAFAQPAAKKAIVPAASATTMVNAKAQQSKNIMNPRTAEKFGINGFKKQAATPRSLKPTLKHVATYASKDPEKAMIKLVVGDCWDDGTGYQILIDSDAHLCDTSFYSGLNQSIIRTYYDIADIKIPASASPVVGETSILDFESDSTEIAPGIYDVLVVNPSDPVAEGEVVHVYVAGGNSELDDFEFEKGYTYIFEMSMAGTGDYCSVIGPFDLSADALALPVLSCEIENTVDVKLTVTNNGSADVENFRMWYYVARDADTNFVPDTMWQTISASLAAGATETYTFNDQVADIQKDSLYVIYAGITPLAKEMGTEDNVTISCFTKKDGLTTLPYEFDLETYDFVPGTPSGWVFGETEDGSYIAEAYDPSVPLVSRCFDLEGGKVYRLSYDYWAGMLFWIFQFSENYHIGFGQNTTPIEDWNTILEEEGVFVEDWTSMDILLKPETTGTYGVYFSADLQGLMGLRNITITEVMDHDARLNAFNTGLARLTPAEQVNGNFTATATVQNRGGKAMTSATVEVKMNGTAVGSATVSNVAVDAIVDVQVPLTVNGLKVGDKVTFIATVNLAGEEEAQQKDNTAEQEVEVSDYVMAYDYVTEDMYTDDYGIGAQGSIGCGIPFNLVAKDTLTAVSLGWMELESDQMVGIRIQKWNSATKVLGDMIYETSVRRGMSAGQREYEVPAIILEAGEYMISAIQTTSTFYGLISDKTPGVGLYVTTADPVNYQDNLGTPAIRAVFGPNAKPKAKDVFVQEITKPKAQGLFAENQEVAANVSNQGHEAVTAPISLMVNGKVVATKQVAIGSYGSAEVSFVTDLSTPNTEYVLTVFSALEGDEDLTNDTCVKTVRSLAPADPYTMNFEYCEDFVVEGFNPAWKTVDVDAEATYGFSGLSFPHSGEAFAFIAFNPGEIGLTEDGTMVAHGGDRLGASFASYAGVNDDWLISPKLKIAAGKEYMNFFVKTYVDDYGLEKYNVLVSTTNDNISSFTKIGATREAPVEDWEEVTIDLKEYSGKEVYLAIQCVSEDAFIFMIDDITVCGGVANENAARLETQLSVYPNPAKEMVSIHAQDAVINHVDIFNVAGMMVYQSNTLNTTDYRYSVSKLNAGIYFARVTTDKGIAVVKFVVR